MREQFLNGARRAIHDADLQRALDQNAERRGRGRSEAFASLPNLDAVRSKAQAIRSAAIERLPELLMTFTEQLQKNGWQVHRAETAAEACEQIVQIAKAEGAGSVVKSKSMVTEEIGLNQALLEAGITPIETDLGEYIVQLRDEPPGHIITPAIHLLRKDVAETFKQHLGIEFTTDVSELNQAARRVLREAFFHARVGISGVNFGVADRGAICLVTNEGNGRMVTSIPDVHIAVMGMERIVPSFDDLAVMLQILTRSATGQVLSSYTSWIRSPRRGKDLDGASTRHIILVDNGRTSMRNSRERAALMCIRCGACLNICPVFREIGGHTYESVYPGPIGSVISPSLFGFDKFGHLAKASTLCGACREACPVDIDLPTLLLQTRDQYIRYPHQSKRLAFGFRLFSWLSSSPRRYSLAMKAAALLAKILPSANGWLTNLPPPFNAWTVYRDFPGFDRRPFRDRFREYELGVNTRFERIPVEQLAVEPDHGSEPTISVFERFSEALSAVGGEIRCCSRGDLAGELITQLKGINSNSILIDPLTIDHFPNLPAEIQTGGFKWIEPCIELDISGDERQRKLGSLDAAAVGITLCHAALADSGTIVIGQDRLNAAVTSLLPHVHIAIVPHEKIFTSMSDWIHAEGEAAFDAYQSITFVTGPSRTADIEMTLTIGVHGPERLIVLVITG